MFCGEVQIPYFVDLLRRYNGNVNPFVGELVMADSLESDQNPDDPSAEMAPKIDGWLRLPAIGLVVGPILYVVTFIRDINAGFLDGLRQLSEEFPGFMTAAVVTIIIDFLFIGFQVYVAVRFFKKHRGVPRLIIILLLANIVTKILSCYWFTKICGALDSDGLRSVVSAVVVGMIWIPYFLLPKRVKQTFVLPRREQSVGHS